jgi:TonB family protein
VIALALLGEFPGCDFRPYRPLRISDWLWQGGIVRSPRPAYPAEAKGRGVAGGVVVAVLIRRDGRVAQACALSGDRRLREAAVAAALQWRFHLPIALPRPIEERLTFRFVLAGASR